MMTELTRYEEKFGKRDATAFCPNCCCTVPVYYREFTDRFGTCRIRSCMKCLYFGGETVIAIGTTEPGHKSVTEAGLKWLIPDIDEVIERMRQQAGR
jgi:hypothetical protein